MKDQRIVASKSRLPDQLDSGLSRAPIIPSELEGLRRTLRQVKSSAAARQLLVQYAGRLHEANLHRTAGVLEFASRLGTLRLMKKAVTEFHVPATLAELSRLESIAARADEELTTEWGKQLFNEALDQVQESLRRWDELALGGA